MRITKKRVYIFLGMLALVAVIAGCAPGAPRQEVTPAVTRLIRRPAITPSPQVGAEAAHVTPTPSEKGVVRVKPNTLRQGDHWPTRPSTALFALITGPSAWREFLARHHATDMEWPPIDWRKEVVFVALMGGRNTGGYQITVEDVLVQQNLIVVRVRERTPQPGEMVIQVLTSPFHVVTIPRRDLPQKDVTLRVIVGKRVLETHIPDLREDGEYAVKRVDALRKKGNEY